MENLGLIFSLSNVDSFFEPEIPFSWGERFGFVNKEVPPHYERHNKDHRSLSTITIFWINQIQTDKNLKCYFLKNRQFCCLLFIMEFQLNHSYFFTFYPILRKLFNQSKEPQKESLPTQSIYNPVKEAV